MLLMRLLYSIWIGVLWGAAGMLLGVAFGDLFEWPWLQSALVGGALAGVVGFIYGLLTPRRVSKAPRRSERSRLAPKRCAWCGGSGREPKRPKQQCSVCLGRGGVLTEQPDHRCSRCKGRGRLAFGRRCVVCDGAGVETYALYDHAAFRRRRRQQPVQKRSWWRLRSSRIDENFSRR